MANGVFMTNCSGVSIVGNDMMNVPYFLNLSGITDFVINSNNFSTNLAQTAGACIIDKAVKGVINGNIVVSNNTACPYGFSIRAGSKYISVNGNTVLGFTKPIDITAGLTSVVDSNNVISTVPVV